jgi:hypothetical protein
LLADDSIGFMLRNSDQFPAVRAAGMDAYFYPAVVAIKFVPAFRAPDSVDALGRRFFRFVRHDVYLEQMNTTTDVSPIQPEPQTIIPVAVVVLDGRKVKSLRVTLAEKFELSQEQRDTAFKSATRAALDVINLQSDGFLA